MVICKLSSFSRGVKFWSVNQISICENFESKAFKSILCERSNDWPSVLFGINVYKTFESCW